MQQQEGEEISEMDEVLGIYWGKDDTPLEAVSALLADLRSWCSTHNVSFERALARTAERTGKYAALGLALTSFVT